MTKTNNMLIGGRTYGVYNPTTKKFWCTHGAWEANIKIIDDNTCILFKEAVTYEFIDKIPEDYNYT